jgi:hypothetical protein
MLRYCVLLLIVYQGAALILLWATDAWDRDSSGAPRLIDFAWTWIGARAVIAGEGARVYDQAWFAAAQIAEFGTGAPGRVLFHWVYPPMLLLYVAPLGLLPFKAALVLWLVATFGLHLASVSRILGRPWAPILAIAPPTLGINVALGQGGFLTAGLMGLALAVLEKRPFLGGALLGLLSYKPQLGILFPVALIAAGQWRAIGAAALVSIGLAGLATACFGTAIWPGFTHGVLATDPRTLMPESGVEPTLQTFYGLGLWLGLGPDAARWGQIGLAGAAATLVWIVWRRPVPYALKAACLSAASLAATPYLLAYDLLIIAVPVGFLLTDMAATGARPEEAWILAAGWALMLQYQWPIGPFVVVMLLSLISVRVFQRPGEAPRTLTTAPRAP